MTYDFKCTGCDHVWEITCPISDRDLPLTEPCPACNETSNIRRLVAAPGISYEGALNMRQRAGSGWNDVLTKIDDASGYGSTIETK